VLILASMGWFRACMTREFEYSGQYVSFNDTAVRCHYYAYLHICGDSHCLPSACQVKGNG